VCLPYRARRISVVKNASHNFAYVRATFSTDNGLAAGAGSGNSSRIQEGQDLVSEVDSGGVGPGPITIIFKLCAEQTDEGESPEQWLQIEENKSIF